MIGIRPFQRSLDRNSGGIVMQEKSDGVFDERFFRAIQIFDETFDAALI
jgi:hypothetical protein